MVKRNRLRRPFKGKTVATDDVGKQKMKPKAISPSPLIKSGAGLVKYKAEQDFTGQALASSFIEGEG